MKINWGVGIVLAFALFMSFILYFVIEVQSNSKYDNELVVKEYYKKDMLYEQEMNQVRNAEILVEKPQIISATQGLAVRFPETWQEDLIVGSVALYRPSASRMDFELPIRLSGSQMLVPDSFLAPGKWQVTLKWRYDGKKYMIKKQIYRTP